MIPAYFTSQRTALPARVLGCYTYSHNLGQQIAGRRVCKCRGIRVIGTLGLGSEFWEREAGSDSAYGETKRIASNTVLVPGTGTTNHFQNNSNCACVR